jgi:hypothetical protein
MSQLVAVEVEQVAAASISAGLLHIHGAIALETWINVENLEFVFRRPVISVLLAAGLWSDNSGIVSFGQTSWNCGHYYEGRRVRQWMLCTSYDSPTLPSNHGVLGLLKIYLNNIFFIF